MNTEKMMQFDVLEMEALEMIEGGRRQWGNCENAIVGGAGLGAIFGGPLGALGLGMVSAAIYC